MQFLDLTKEEWAPFEEVRKTWRGPLPYECGQTIGFWVLRGWFDIEEERALKNYSLLQKKRYAQQKMLSWYPKFKSGEIRKETIDLKEAEDFYELQILIYDEDRIRAPKDEIELYEADVIQIAEGVRNSFKTPGYNRGGLRAFMESKVKGAISKFIFIGWGVVKAIPQTVINMYKDWRGRDNKLALKDIFKANFLKALDESVEVLQLGKIYLQDLLFRLILPYGFIHMAGYFIGSVTATSLNKLLASYLAGSTLGVFGVSFLLALVFGKVLKSYWDKGRDRFLLVSQDIFGGAVTPEKIEAQYNAKIQEIMDNPDLSWREMKEQMLELHKEFQLQVRPAIEKGLYLSGSMEDQNANEVIEKIRTGVGGFFSTIKSKFAQSNNKKGSVSHPVSLKMVDSKVMLTLQCEFEDYLKNGDGATLLYKTMSGEEPLDEEIREYLEMNPSVVESIQSQLEGKLNFS